jgi:hypothetical protein
MERMMCSLDQLIRQVKQQATRFPEPVLGRIVVDVRMRALLIM